MTADSERNSDYLTLLRICETGKYKDVDFLKFLRSGEADVEQFVR